MNFTEQHIRELLKKYRNQIATEEEFERLFDYLQNPENLEILRHEFEEEWRSKEDLSFESPVDWNDIQKVVRRRAAQERKEKVDREHRRHLWVIAASFLLIVGMSISLFYYKALFSHEIVFTTGYGEVESIRLDDGSKVTLNANSTISWDKKWMEKGMRRVVLSGEAYFDVESIELSGTSEKMGFEVVTKDLIIDVVGTSFNVKSRDEKTAVFLDEGEVHLNLRQENDDSLPDQAERKGSESKDDKIIMQAGESVSYSIRSRELERAMGDLFGNASWTIGTFVFTQESVAKIFRSLEDIYGKQFEVKESDLLNRELTTALPYSDWPIVKSALELLLNAELVESGERVKVEIRE